MASINHNGVLGLLLLLIVTMFGASSSADTYTVGDDLGWTNPPLGNVAYSTWAKTKSFDIGDVLGKFFASPIQIRILTSFLLFIKQIRVMILLNQLVLVFANS